MPAAVGDHAATLGLKANALPTLVVGIAQPRLAELHLGVTPREGVVRCAEALCRNLFEYVVDFDKHSLREEPMGGLGVAHSVEQADLPVDRLALDLFPSDAVVHGEDSVREPLDGIHDPRDHHRV